MNAANTMEEIEKRAAEWILRRDREGDSEQNRAALEAWLSQDARHREAYLALDELWDLTGEMKQWHPRDGRIDADLLAPLASRPERTKVPRMLLIAATLLSVVGGLGWLGYSMHRGEEYSTPVGGYARIALEDGSVLQLNTDTVVRAKITQFRRTVRLLRGEAYFDVAQDHSRPFEVRTGRSVVRAIGTAFSVRVGADERVELLVTQGRVLLKPAGSDLRAPLIIAGQTARAGSGEVVVGSVESQEMSRRLAWQQGQLVFDRQPLSQVTAEFNRYNHRQVKIESEALRSLRLTGNFKATDLDSFIAAIQSAAEVEVHRTEQAVAIRSQ